MKKQPPFSKPRLFLGFALTPSLFKELELLPLDRQAFFVSRDGADETYLQRIFQDNMEYLGKFVEGEPDLATCELLAANIKSIAAKYLPAIALEVEAFRLFPHFSFAQIDAQQP